jgi:predicted peptidase
MRVFPLVAIILAVVAAVPLGQSRQANTGFLDRSVVLSGVMRRFQVYVPSDYIKHKAWPVLVDLHGGGAQGDDGIRQTVHFLADQIRLKRSRFPLIAVFPQAARGTTWDSPAMQEMVIAEIDNAMAEFSGDPHRLYLSGFSMGGAGVYEMAARWPERFAALVAISGFVPTNHTDLVERIRRIPLRMFHGASDERVPVDSARRLAADLKKAGAPVQYFEYPDARHGPTAEKTYADASVIDWLLSQHRK